VEKNNEDVKKLTKENNDLKRENANLKQNVKDLKANISVLYHHTKIIFKDKFRDFRELINGSMKKQGLNNQFEQEHTKRLRARNQGLER
jgi:phage host-nuclease inhibitor protein Gam